MIIEDRETMAGFLIFSCTAKVRKQLRFPIISKTSCCGVKASPFLFRRAFTAKKTTDRQQGCKARKMRILKK